MIRITSGGIVIDIADEIDRGHLNAGWNTVVSTDEATVEIFRDPVEAAVADFERAKAEAEQRIEQVQVELEAKQEELAQKEAELEAAKEADLPEEGISR